MNYAAPSQRYAPILQRPTFSQRVEKVTRRIEVIFDSIMNAISAVVGVTFLLLKFVCGIDVMGKIFPQGSILCSLCVCGAILGAASSVGIALGVGLGVGLNCAETQYFPSPNTTNFTTNNNTSSFAETQFFPNSTTTNSSGNISVSSAQVVPGSG